MGPCTTNFLSVSHVERRRRATFRVNKRRHLWLTQLGSNCAALGLTYLQSMVSSIWAHAMFLGKLSEDDLLLIDNLFTCPETHSWNPGNRVNIN